MDKGQAQILFLVLIAAAFIGQAIHDFIKKNRANSRRTFAHTAKRRDFAPARHAAAATSPYGRINAAKTAGKAVADNVVTADKTTELPEQYEPESTISAGDVRQTPSPDRDELRRAVIWSEILNRKF